jgi:MarR-like DNA-binding transcriptional regulator SgrR of sgrS sRNA
MQQQTEVTDAKRGNGRASPRGRKDQTTGQEAAISLRPIKDGIEELVTLYTQQEESAARCSDAIKAAAEQSGLLANVIRRFVKARAGDKFEEAKRTVEQLSLVFEELGEA